MSPVHVILPSSPRPISFSARAHLETSVSSGYDGETPIPQPALADPHVDFVVLRLSAGAQALQQADDVVLDAWRRRQQALQLASLITLVPLGESPQKFMPIRRPRSSSAFPPDIT